MKKTILGIITILFFIPFVVNAETQSSLEKEEQKIDIQNNNPLNQESTERYFTFNMNTSAPSTSNPKYYSNSNPYYKAGMHMPNCTTYAYGRFWEVWGDEPGLPLTKALHPTTIYWHAKNDSDSIYKNHVGQKPGLGAIAVWSTIPNDNPTAGSSDGHVAIVERVESNGDIYTSNSGYPSNIFYMHTYSKANNYNYWSNGKAYYFQGFVYQPRFHFIIE